MKKTYSTSKSKSEIQYILSRVPEIKKQKNYDITLYPIHIRKNNKVSVTAGYSVTSWELDLNTAGQIFVKRKISLSDVFAFLVLLSTYLVMIYLMFLGGIVLMKLLALIVLGFGIFSGLYFFRIKHPYGLLLNFMKKYL